MTVALSVSMAFALCVPVFPASTRYPSRHHRGTRSDASSSLGVSEAQATQYFPASLQFEDVQPVDGLPRRMGQTADHLDLVEVLGPSSGLHKITVVVTYDHDVSSAAEAVALMCRVTENVDPTWGDAALTWVDDNVLKVLNTGGDASVSIVRHHIRFKIKNFSLATVVGMKGQVLVITPA